MRAARIERVAQTFFELAAGDEILDVDLMARVDLLARCQAKVGVVRIARNQLFLDGQISQVARIADAARCQDFSLMIVT